MRERFPLLQELVKEEYTHVGTNSFHVTLIRTPAIWVAKGMNISAATPPVALAYLSGFLRQAGYSVSNIDALGMGLDTLTKPAWNHEIEAQGLTPEQIVEAIPVNTNLIGVSCMFSIEWPYTRNIISLIRKSFPKVPIVAGGEHISALPEFSMEECPALDFAVLGEGENLLLHLADVLREKKSLPWLPGLVYRHEGKFVRTDNTPSIRTMNGASGVRIKDLDSIPLPAWDLTPIETYLTRKLTFGRYVGKTMPIVGSRGCPYECTFCSNPSMWGRKYLTRSPQQVVAEILEYKEKYGIDAVEFYDLTPIITKKWIVEFSDELIRTNAKIKWQISGGTRCEAIDEEVIVKVKQAGCEYLGFAPESGVQSVLDRIKKKINLQHLLFLIRISKVHKMDTRCNLIIGFPDDTRMQIWATLIFQFRLALMGVVDCPVFHFVPYPGSELFERLRKENTWPKLDDEYFESLGGNFQLHTRHNYCPQVPFLELMFYRVFGTSLFYLMTYLRHPIKIVRFVSNLISYQSSASVFEQRVIQNVQRMRGRKRSS